MKIKKALFTIRFDLSAYVSFHVSLLFAQQLPPKQAYPFNVKQIHVGHSLTDPLFYPWPGPFNHLLANLNGLNSGSDAWGTLTGPATLPGAWMRFHWDTSLSWCGSDPNTNCYESGMYPRKDISRWQLMIITENMEGPLILNAHQSREHLSLFVNNNWQNGNNSNGAPTLLWTNWCGLDGTSYFLNGYGVNSNPSDYSGWRQLLDSLEKGWQIMQDYANANKPTNCPPVYIIPGNRMMARFYDDVKAGKVPGITSVNQIFTDGVHLNHLGAYMVTMIHYACIFNKNPLGLPNTLGPVTVPLPFADYVQKMVWDLVKQYPRSGIYEPSSTSEQPLSLQLRVFPNPVSTFAFIEGIESDFIELLDISGKKFILPFTQNNQLNLEGFAQGIYLLKAGSHCIKIIKE